MKTRNGFVSNSSSCSFVVDLKRKVESPKDLEKILNRNFWKEAKKSGDWTSRYDRIYDNLSENFSYEDLCDLLFRLMQDSDQDNGKWIIDRYIEDFASEDLPPYPEYRKERMNIDYLKDYYKTKLKSDSIDTRFEAEKRLWEEYESYYKSISKSRELKEIIEELENPAYFSFGNESEHFNEGTDRFTETEVRMISVLRNFGLADILFKYLDYCKKEYS